ncbi:MAG: hypothetical protein GXO88_10755 [Chlorobi bacterium]|nr:hypothetical protein [Chlorobiota bacterium]
MISFDDIKFHKRFLNGKGMVIDMFKTTSLIFLSLVIFISSSGFKVSMHFCENTLYDIGILSQADNCYKDASHHHNVECCLEMEKVPKNACENETFEFHKLDSFVATAINMDLSSNIAHDLTPAVISIFNLVEEPTNKHITVFVEDSPPMRLTTTLSLLQSFLL